jgi:hypothetical protein
MLDKAQSTAIYSAGGTGGKGAMSDKEDMLRYEFTEFCKDYAAYIKLRRQFLELKMEQAARAKLIEAMGKIIGEYRKTIETRMDKMEEPLHTWTFVQEPETITSSH